MKAYAVILAGGSGRRMGYSENKIFLTLNGIPAIIRAIAPFTGFCAGAVVVSREEDMDEMQSLVSQYHLTRFVKAVVPGGATRQGSVKNGLDALPEDTEIVLIHDGARALVTEDVIRRALESAEKKGCGIAAIKVTDTIKKADESGIVTETLNRDELYAMQTPQAFQVELIRKAHLLAAEKGVDATDDAALLELAGLPVYLSPGEKENLKLTTPEDLAFGEAILRMRREREALE